jgi:glucosamine--fructose-6-phosphate aminotransferase (isomerizing)
MNLLYAKKKKLLYIETMCGIVGILFETNEVQNFNILLSCLKELQNRGYDSMGISIIDSINSKFLIDKKIGTDGELFHYQILNYKNFLGHTRWATHGPVTVENAHPHIDSILDKFSMVHNGIIENYLSIKDFLASKSIYMKSDTDSEILLNLIVYEYTLDKTNLTDEDKIKNAICSAIQKVEGTYGIVIQMLDHPDKLFCIRKGSPLLIGTDANQTTLIISSEKQAFPSFITKYIRVDSNELVICKFNNHHLTKEFLSSSKPFQLMVESKLENYKYFTEKEIYDQVDLIRKVTKNGSRLINGIKLGGLDSIRSKLSLVKNIYLFGCGTSYHSCLILQNLFLEYGHFDSVISFDACDFEEMYLPRHNSEQSCGIFISQSGETRDLLKIHSSFAERFVTLGIINVVDSYLASVTDGGFYTNIGKEKGVASTKSFTAQIISGMLILLWFLKLQNTFSQHISLLSKSLLTMDNTLKSFIPSTFQYCMNYIIPQIQNYSKMFLLGRKKDFFIAKEGALKIKEISYKCAEAYSSAALKHGPFALLDKDYLVIFILSDDSDENVKKVMNNVQEVKSRGAKILIITTENVACDEFLTITIPNHTFGFIYSSIALQIIAYLLSIQAGINPDYPKNLAKVVTVE